MYTEYFGLKEKPFSIAPDPHYFFMSEGHREALAHLLYGIKGEGGFVLLTGEVGTGKTTVCRLALELVPDDLEIAFILNPPMTVEELVATICDEFKIGYPLERTVKDFVARIHAHLLDVHARGRRAVLIIEEAQNLTIEVLEQVRLLTNLETNAQKLLQIIMLGQPELKEKLNRPQLRQLSQRITARYHLGPLSRKEVASYVNYRLSTAGLARPHLLFPERTLSRLFRLTRGVPRLINVMCDRALLGTFVQGKELVDLGTLTTAAREVTGNGNYAWPRRKAYENLALVVLLALCVLVAATYYASVQWPLTTATERAIVKGSAMQVDVAGTQQTGVEKPSRTLPGGTRAEATHALFERWEIEYRPEGGGTVCDQARAQGLRCEEGTGGGLSALQKENRPAVLRLVDQEGTDGYALLTALDGTTATCAVSNDTRTFDVGIIARQWSGDYLLLTLDPSDYKEKLKPGRRGPPVAWLDRQLALAQHRVAKTGREHVYDQEMVKQVKAFQRTAGLTPDGIAGLRTILALTGAVGDGGPTLRRDEKASK